MQTQAPLLLASTSTYRAQRLSTLGLDFKQAAPQCDETPIAGESPEALCLRLSRQKADSLTDQFPDYLIIGSDQTASLDNGERLGKPGSIENAIAQLVACSGKRLRFYTGVALAGPVRQAWTVVTDVQFRTLSRAEIERYVAIDAPLDCAGSFKVEGLGISLFESVQSDDPNALIGLPLISLASRLRAIGWQVP